MCYKQLQNRLVLNRLVFVVSFVVLSILSGSLVRAEEGMWLFTAPPTQKIKEIYGYELTPAFLDHLQKASVRFGNGGSGSFVSSQGLIMTNHHVAFSSLQKLSNAERDLVKNGFYAKTPEEELPCPHLELIVLLQMDNVTDRINREVTQKKPSESESARRAVMNTIEQEALNKLAEQGKNRDDYKCEVVPFYEGALCYLYTYKKLRDVRLVFAPEDSVGYFGGEPDNFEYPRYNLDVSFFRAYENGKPMTPPSFLAWSDNGAANGELVFVSGHPGRTNRFNTIEHLLFQRNYLYPYILERVRRQEVLLQAYSEKGEKEKLRVVSDLFRLRNTRKNRSGILLGLQTPELIDIKRKFNDDTRKSIIDKNLIDLKQNDPWQSIENSLKIWQEIYITYDMLEENTAFDSKLYRLAKSIVRYVAEKEKPEKERLRGYSSSSLPGVKAQILQEEEFCIELEILRLADSLGFYVEKQLMQKEVNIDLLGSLSPREMAVQLITKTKLNESKERKRLLEMDWATLQKSEDPLIRFALKVDQTARLLRSNYDNKIAEPMRQAYSTIARARFQAEGTSLYPDATFTLRLAYGKVAGYTEDDGSVIPPWTTMDGTYRHAEEHQYLPPYNLSEVWVKNRSKIDPKTPMNLVSTDDIIGGNSGSPLVNGKGEVVGLIFDGNVQSLTGNFIYTEKQARAVSVHSSAIREGVKIIYQAARIAEELGK